MRKHPTEDPVRPAAACLALLLAAIPLVLSRDSTRLLADDAAPGSAPPESARRPPTERVTSELVLIETYVRDASGHPIGGLLADDFVLLVDGRRRPIASFEYREFSPAEARAQQPGGLPGR